MRDSLSSERREQFNNDIKFLADKGEEAARAKVGYGSLSEELKPFHGLTATEIHERAEAARR
jgi:hypothetical protein